MRTTLRTGIHTMRHVRSWIRPESLAEALEVLRDQGSRAAYLGGGTLLAQQDDPTLETLVDLSYLGLERMERGPEGLHAGAMTRLEDLRQHPATTSLGQGLLAEALACTRSEAWRNQATLGGRLREACPGDAVMTVLLALDAHVTILRNPTGSPEQLPIEEIGTLDRAALILAVDIPASTGWRHALESVEQSAQDVPILTLCAGTLLLDGRIRAARLVWSGSNTTPRRLHAVEAVLTGAEASLERIEPCQEALDSEPQPPADARAGAAYRAHLRRVLLGRVLRRILAARATEI